MALTVRYEFQYLSPALKGVNLQLNVANLLDRYYVATCVTGPAYCRLGAERTVLTTLTYKW